MPLFARKAALPTVVVITAPPGGVSLNGTATSYATLYRTSGMVRAVVDWLSRGLARYEPITVDEAGEPLKGGADRVAELFRQPAPNVSRFELLEHLAVSLCTTGNAYAPLVLDAEGAVRGITPTAAPVSLERPNGGPPSMYKLQTLNGVEDVRPEDLVHIRLANPTDPWLGLSPLDSLRTLLSEEQSASEQRGAFWQRSLRKDGVIEQAVDAPRMSDAARESFLTDMEVALQGSQGAATPLMLEPGMSFRDISFTPREIEFVQARQQALALVCGAFGVPSQLVAASTENVRAASAMYEEVLAPWTERFEAALTSQLVPRLYGEDRVFVRLLQPAPIVDKDTGSVLDAAIKAGRITPNEGRKVTGLPPVDGGDQLTPASGGGA